MTKHLLLGGLFILAAVDGPAGERYAGVPLANVVERSVPATVSSPMPSRDDPFIEHVRQPVMAVADAKVKSVSFDSTGDLFVVLESGEVRRWVHNNWETIENAEPVNRHGLDVTARIEGKEGAWYGTDAGLYFARGPNDAPVKHERYGVEGPLSTRITALAYDSRGTLWIGTPLGLSCRTAQGVWNHLRGREGLPVEDVTALAVDKEDHLWIGTSQGAIFYRPETEGRRWFYRAGPRYLPDDQVLSVACAPDGTPYFVTRAGLSRIARVRTTLLERAQTIEKLINERHRRLGLVAECMLDNADNPTAHSIGDSDNDGLWTAYHVAAMSLCYGATREASAKTSAKESMHALYKLQNVSGTPGLAARSVVSAELGKSKSSQWRPAADGALYWKSDTSSDEIDGHYLAFYTYWEHIAKDDAQERDLCARQTRALTDYIVDHNYQLIDWTGKRTLWGFWNPENLNDDPEHYLENGLNSLQMLSFLKVAHHITGDAKYQTHYHKLIMEHHYLSNVLLEKKVFPDEHNHSDDQLAFVAWYPILQLERDPDLRAALYSGVRRHYEIVAPEKPSFYIFSYATIDSHHADLPAALENLREIPTDRRSWRMRNSHRSDVRFEERPDRFNRRQLAHVLPADERAFEKWNGNPYMPDGGGDGRHEDDGAAFLLPYWMARYHGFISE